MIKLIYLEYLLCIAQLNGLIKVKRIEARISQEVSGV